MTEPSTTFDDSVKREGARGRLVVISGCSGAGKSTIAERLLADEHYARARTATTRAPRGEETDGVEYDFLTEEAFREGLENGDFLEHAEVYGHLYGTPSGNLEEVLASGRHCVLVVDVQGAATLRRLGLDALFVFIQAPSPEELQRRLQSRSTDDPDEIERRLQAAERERTEAKHFDVVLINEDINETTRRLASEAGLEWRPAGE